ncbi:MAG: enoyl-CoA hydratase [Actinomycetota bacterium]
MSEQVVTLQQDGAVAWVTMNRPEVRNAMNTALIDSLDSCMKEADSDPSVNVIVLGAAGPHFSAGHDLKAYVGEAQADEWHEKRKTPEGKFEHERKQYFEKCLAIRNLEKPTIAMVQGKCVAAGVALAAMCDLIVASEDAVFSNPVLRMSGAGVEVLSEVFDLGVRKAKEFLWTGDEIDAREAWRLGLVNRVVPAESLRKETDTLAQRIAKMPAITVQNVKRSLNHAQDLAGFRNALEYHFMVHQFQHNTKTSLDALEARKQKTSMKDVFSERDKEFE